MNKVVIAPAVFSEGKVKLVDEFAYRTEVKARGFAEGECLIVRVEPESEAGKWSDYKYLFGYVFDPVVQDTGHTDDELCLMAKLKFFPDDGRTSLTQLTRDELREFIQKTEAWLREERPEAFEKHGKEYVA